LQSHENQSSEGKEQTMKKTEDGRLKEIKRMKILDDSLVFFGKGKIGFKEPKDMKHYIMQFLKDGIVDLHETIGREGGGEEASKDGNT